MAGMMGIFISLAKALCGGSTTQKEAHTESQKPEVVAERPPIIPQRRSKPKSKPASHHGPKLLTKRPQIPPQRRSKQERKLASHPKPKDKVPRKRHRRDATLDINTQESKPVSCPPLVDRPRQDESQINQHDHYVALRTKAKEQRDLMVQSFRAMDKARRGNRRALAKELSEKGRQHKRTMESLDAEASAWIFEQNNIVNRKPGKIDLHDLNVKEAVSYVEKAIQEAREKGDAEIQLIVGKGLHSDGDAKIKPAIEDLMKKNNIPTKLDPHNNGVLIARLR